MISFTSTDVTTHSKFQFRGSFSEKLRLPDVEEVNTLSFNLKVNNVENAASEMSFNYRIGEQHFGVSWEGRGGRSGFRPQCAKSQCHRVSVLWDSRFIP